MIVIVYVMYTNEICFKRNDVNKLFVHKRLFSSFVTHKKKILIVIDENKLYKKIFLSVFRNFGWFMPFTAFIGPMLLMCFVFNEPFWLTWHTTITRWALAVNITWLLNSAAHMWGWRPYDK